MKRITLRIRDKVKESAEIYPLEVEIDGKVTKGKILVADVENQKDLVQHPGRRGGRELGRFDPAGNEPQPNKEFALWLHKLVFSGNLDATWKREILPFVKTGVRLVVDVEPPELLRFRWEQMGSSPVYPAFLPKCSLVRGRICADAPVAVRDGPIKILVVVGSRPPVGGEDPVEAEAEVRQLEEAFADRVNEVELKVLWRPSRDRLTPQGSKLSELYDSFKPHIFHFIGHGKIDKISHEPCLFLYNETYDREDPWTLTRISGDLGNHKPALVILNACHSVDAVGRVEGTQAVWSISDIFINLIGARAVLGMHAAVRGDTAGKFAVTLYQAILRGEDLDLALTAARISIDQFKDHDASRGWDWALPYLRVTVPPDQVLGMAPVFSYLDQLDKDGNEFKETSVLVDRVDERRGFLNQLQCETPRNSSLLLVQGDRDVGKTDLVRCCLRTAATRGRLIKYVELNHNVREDDQGIIRLICEGTPNSLIRKPLPQSAMATFYQTYNALIDRKDPRDKLVRDGCSDTPPWERDEGFQKLPRKGGDQEQVKLLYEALVKALFAVPSAARQELAEKLRGQGDPAASQAQSDRRPFLLVIDQIAQDSVMVDLFLQAFVPRFLKPFAEANHPDILVVLVVAEPDCNVLGLGTDKLGAVPVRSLSDFPRATFCELAMQYFDKFIKLPLYKNRNLRQENWKQLVEAYDAAFLSGQETWKPSTLRYLRQSIPNSK